MIELESLDEIEAFFVLIAGKPGQRQWDLSKPMRWGYFFTSRRRDKLVLLTSLLEQDGYNFIELNDETLDCCLWMEKIEVHDSNSLFERNAQLAVLASQFSVESYGNNVGLATS